MHGPGVSALRSLTIPMASTSQQRLDRVVARLQNLPVIALPTDYPRPSGNRVVEAVQSRALPGDAALGLVRLALFEDESEDEDVKRARPTPFQLLLSAFIVLLHRYTGDNDVVIASSSGFQRDPLLLRVNLEPQDPFWAIVRRVQMLLKEAADNAVPYEAVLQALGRSLGGSSIPDGPSGPLFRVRFFDETDQPEGDFITNTSLTSDLTVFVTRPTGSTHTSLIPDITIRIMYNALLFTSSRISFLTDQLATFLQAVSKNPMQAVGAASLITPSQKTFLPSPIADLNWCDWKGAITDVFSRNARESPHRTCVVQTISASETRSTRIYTYRDILSASNVVAQHLIKNGVQREEVVMVYAYRSVEMLVAVLGILKAGAVFSVIGVFAWNSKRIQPSYVLL